MNVIDTLIDVAVTLLGAFVTELDDELDILVNSLWDAVD